MAASWQGRGFGAARIRAVALVALATFLPHVTSAAAAGREVTTNREFAETVAKTTTETEEVIVSGRLDDLSSVEKAISDAEDRFLDRYNELNDDSRYDVKCQMKATTGHRIALRHCEPGYVAEAKREDAVYEMLRFGNQNVRVRPTHSVVLAQLPAMQARMRDIVGSDPDLQRALIERALLVERYEKLAKKKHSGNWMVWD
jgi:predicted glycoside hydrolase/deacetylase ChbG (UPF0249 family)